MTRIGKPEITLEKFKAKITIDANGCWIWQGALKASGYGWVTFRKKQMGAHRLSMILNGIEIPAGKCVCHSCDVPACCNPDHLFVGTYGDNMLDMYSKNRHIRHTLPTSNKLNTTQVIHIKERLLSESQSDIARSLGVVRGTIGLIARGKTWKEVTC